MTMELAAGVERQLRELLVEEAIRRFLEAEAITDLSAREIADTQRLLAGELPAIPEWSKSRR